MDVVRYADTAGDNADYPIPEARLYRDYIIDAFNDDLPYDIFLREQLAGDLLDSDRFPRRVIATGFLALSRRYATAQPITPCDASHGRSALDSFPMSPKKTGSGISSANACALSRPSATTNGTPGADVVWRSRK